MNDTPTADDALTATEVAEQFGVDPKTVHRWVKTGRLACFTTPGSTSRRAIRRFRRTDIEHLRGTR